MNYEWIANGFDLFIIILRTSFHCYDEDGDGYINQSELALFLTSIYTMTLNMNKEGWMMKRSDDLDDEPHERALLAASDCFLEIDRDYDGLISQNEFVKWALGGKKSSHDGGVEVEEEEEDEEEDYYHHFHSQHHHPSAPPHHQSPHHHQHQHPSKHHHHHPSHHHPSSKHHQHQPTSSLEGEGVLLGSNYTNNQQPHHQSSSNLILLAKKLLIQASPTSIAILANQVTSREIGIDSFCDSLEFEYFFFIIFTSS